MEPTTTASVILSGISAVVGAILGNRTDAGVVLAYQKLYENLEQYRPDGNHDLERAIYRAYLQASIHTLRFHYDQFGYDSAGWVRWGIFPQWLAALMRRWRTHPYLGKTRESERQWIEATLAHLEGDLLPAARENYLADLQAHPALLPAREQYVLLLRPPAGEAQVPDLRVPLLANVLADLERRTPGTPDGVAKALRTHWFDQFCGCFQALFKNDGKVQSIVLGKLLAGVGAQHHCSAHGALHPKAHLCPGAGRFRAQRLHSRTITLATHQ